MRANRLLGIVVATTVSVTVGGRSLACAQSIGPQTSLENAANNRFGRTPDAGGTTHFDNIKVDS